MRSGSAVNQANECQARSATVFLKAACKQCRQAVTKATRAGGKAAGWAIDIEAFCRCAITGPSVAITSTKTSSTPCASPSPGSTRIMSGEFLSAAIFRPSCDARRSSRATSLAPLSLRLGTAGACRKRGAKSSLTALLIIELGPTARRRVLPFGMVTRTPSPVVTAPRRCSTVRASAEAERACPASSRPVPLTKRHRGPGRTTPRIPCARHCAAGSSWWAAPCAR